MKQYRRYPCLPRPAKAVWLPAIFFLLGLWSMTAQGQETLFRFRNPALPAEERVRLLLSALTLEEKAGLLGYNSQPVPRLGVPAYNWWNEALHGVARAGQATVFPQAIALAATFNDSLVRAVGNVISTEARAKYNEAVRRGNRSQYLGLTFWSPNVNIFRDPRWGRGQETYGEDPFLTGALGAAFVQGMQGSHPRYLKTAACAKHFAVHSGPEAQRHSFNAMVDETDLRETYLYAFRKLVDAGVESVMCAYNRLNGQPCCSNDTLLTSILRREWRFKGHVVSDCWALDDIYKGHKTLDNPVAVAAAAIKAGLNLDCSGLLQEQVLTAVQQGLLTEAQIDNALSATLLTQIKLGVFDDPALVPYSTLGAKEVHAAAHVQLARTAARQSMVLLKNDHQVLPLDKTKYRSLMVIGANAASVPALVASYNGISSDLVTFVEGITGGAGAAMGVQYEQGSDYSDTARLGGIWAAGQTDVTIAVVGLTPQLEGEEHDAFLSHSGGDRTTLSIPTPHIKLLQELKKNNKPLIVVVTSGSAVDVKALEPYADALLLAWYPGEQGGNALADILFGDVSPSGRLPLTFYASLDDLPAYEDYSMQGRTYRYFKGAVQYPFGYGLSYTRFSYAWDRRPASNSRAGDTLQFSFSLHNEGPMEGDEVVQVYVRYPGADRMPLLELKAFKRVTLGKGERKEVTLAIPVSELQKWDPARQQWVLHPGTYTLNVGGHSRDVRLSAAFRIRD